MSKKLTIDEAEAVLALKGSAEKEWNTLIAYFERRYDFARDKCVDTRVDAVQHEQGMAKAFREIRDIEESANEVYDAIKQQ
jgi:hypothetical protein